MLTIAIQFLFEELGSFLLNKSSLAYRRTTPWIYLIEYQSPAWSTESDLSRLRSWISSWTGAFLTLLILLTWLTSAKPIEQM